MIWRLIILGLVSSLSLQAQALQNTRLSVTEAVDDWTPQDIEAEIYFGRNLSAKMLAQSKLYEDEVAQGYINQLGASLAKNSSRPDLAFYFAILDDGQINAFAAPGGYVFITKGAIEFCENEAELAGILAHEIGHVTERHIVKQLKIRGKNADQMTGLMSAMIQGGGQTLTSAFSLAMDEALDTWKGAGLKDRKDEYQADQISTDILLKTGYDPAALATYLARVSQHKAEVKDRVRTHPPFDLRIQAIQQQVAEHMPKAPIQNPVRLANSLNSIFEYARNEQMANRILLQTPPLESEEFQAYLNQIQGAVLAIQGQQQFMPIFAVYSEEPFYQQYEYFEVISSGLLQILNNEAEISALLVAAKLSANSAFLDEKISLALLNLGYNPQAWLNLLQKFAQNDLLPFFDKAKMRALALASQLPEMGEFHQQRWQSQLRSALSSTQLEGLKPAVALLAPQIKPDADRYLNLVAYAVAKTVAMPSFSGVLVVDADLPIVRVQGSQLLVSSQSLSQIKNEAEWAGLVANSLFYNMSRIQDKTRLADQLYLDADLATTQLLADLGYSQQGWLDYLQRQKNQHEYSIADFPKTNYLVRVAALAEEVKVEKKSLNKGQLHEQRYQNHIQK